MRKVTVPWCGIGYSKPYALRHLSLNQMCLPNSTNPAYLKRTRKRLLLRCRYGLITAPMGFHHNILLALFYLLKQPNPIFNSYNLTVSSLCFMLFTNVFMFASSSKANENHNCWSRISDLNRKALRHWYLRPACLPFSPIRGITLNYPYIIPQISHFVNP